jgi:hypothetical protein
MKVKKEGSMKVKKEVKKEVFVPEKSDGTPFGDFAAEYCSRQEATIQGLRQVLMEQIQRFNPDGFVLLECQMLDSSLCGSYTILPYGPNNTLKSVPTHPVSPRGLASDMSVVKMLLPASAV